MRINKGSLSYYLLYALEKATEGFVFLEEFSYSAQYRELTGMPPITRKRSFSEALRRLRLKGIVEKEINKEGKIILKLTSLGYEFLADKKEEEWDGKYRIVIWDIPENKRRIRDLFRRKLKGWDFKHWQGSVWVSKKNAAKKLKNLISELKIDNWVAVIESDDPSLSHIIFHGRGK